MTTNEETMSDRVPVWMVVRDGLAGPVTFGPFKDRKEAEAFARSGGIVYDDVKNRESHCGPWLP